MRVTMLDIKKNIAQVIGSYVMKGYHFDYVHGLDMNLLNGYITMKNDIGNTISIYLHTPQWRGIGEILITVSRGMEVLERYEYYCVKGGKNEVIFDGEEYATIKAKREARAKLRLDMSNAMVKQMPPKYNEIARRFIERKITDYNIKRRSRYGWSSETTYAPSDLRYVRVFKDFQYGGRNVYRVIYKFKRCKKEDAWVMNIKSGFFRPHDVY